MQKSVYRQKRSTRQLCNPLQNSLFLCRLIIGRNNSRGYLPILCQLIVVLSYKLVGESYLILRSDIHQSGFSVENEVTIQLQIPFIIVLSSFHSLANNARNSKILKDTSIGKKLWHQDIKTLGRIKLQLACWISQLDCWKTGWCVWASVSYFGDHTIMYVNTSWVKTRNMSASSPWHRPGFTVPMQLSVPPMP